MSIVPLDCVMAEEQDEQTLDLTIEALTGTVYDLCVSPYETILGIKTKIQNLEGIPVYQQQLVYGSTELQDEYCLAEYTIPSGAQLKLLIAMRGGPIHAQRVHLDLEDPTLMEIAEFLDSQAGDKYTVMLVRNGDDLDTANFVHVQMHNEDSCESLSCSPVHMPEPHKRISGSASKDTQTEHAVTRDKVKDLMAKLKKVRSYRQPSPQPLTTTQPSSSKLQRKGTSKVLILDSRASSRILHTSSRGSPLPQSQFNESSRLSTAQRRLMFSSGEDRSCCHCLQSSRASKSGNKRSVRAMGAKRAHSPEEETPIMNKKHYSRVNLDGTDCAVFHQHSGMTRVPPMPHPPFTSGMSAASIVPHPPHQTGVGGASHVPRPPPEREGRRKAPKRVRRTSHVETGNSSDLISDLNDQLSRLGLETKDTGSNTIKQTENEQKSDSSSFLPHVSSSIGPVSLTAAPTTTHPRVSSRKLSQGSSGHLPPIARSTGKIINKTGGKRRNRCMQCSKKVGLASTYNCRCGGMFCAAHRYAEAHSCSFDYKTEGRRVLTRNNPVVTAPKLPKI